LPNQSYYFLANQERLLEESTEAVFKLLLDFFSTHSNTRSSFEKAVFDTLFFLCRPGWLGDTLTESLKKEAMEKLLHVGQPLYYSKTDATLRAFAKNATKIIMLMAPPKNVVSEKSARLAQINDISNLIKGSNLETSEDKKTAVANAVFRMYHKGKTKKNNSAIPALEDKNPLRIVLGLPKSQRSALPNNDMRSHILKCTKVSMKKNEVPLMSLLQKAAPFSPRILQSIMSVDLYKRFKPVGYFDHQCLVILIEVTSSSDAYELAFRKAELIKMLKTVPGFERITDIRSVMGTKSPNQE
jgi:hypothetical protein